MYIPFLLYAIIPYCIYASYCIQLCPIVYTLLTVSNYALLYILFLLHPIMSYCIYSSCYARLCYMIFIKYEFVAYIIFLDIHFSLYAFLYVKLYPVVFIKDEFFIRHLHTRNVSMDSIIPFCIHKT